MGGLAIIVIFGILFIIDRNEKRNIRAYYDKKISEAAITGDVDTATRYINLKSNYR